ncbi:MAG TPA: acyl-CoA dehydrogenase family protein, partial [Dongiaceae bacterium]|nr:acyl-CoA dehydrogenase family protein [Dongiaceae bacterium]
MEAFDTAEDRAFRREVRAFFEQSLSDDIRRAMLTGLPLGRELADRWHRVLLAKGWVAPSWPKEHGGTGWTLRQQYIFEQERVAAWAPAPVVFNIDMVGPLFIRYGTPAQKARFLPRVLSAEDHWCQGFSEPGAGSDLAALKCRAVRKGDRYIINGAKIWQTAAFEADMMFGLFRTDSSGRKQQGISVLVLPMSAKGLSLRPILLFDGVERVAQCTFEDVEVPAENLVGEENQGWAIAKYLLTLERLGIAEVAASRACLARLKALARAEVRGNEPLILDPVLLSEIAAVEADLDALEATEYRFLFDAQSNGELGPEASILKIHGTLIRQRLTELTMRVAGPFALATGTALPASAPDAERSFAPWATRHY